MGDIIFETLCVEILHLLFGKFWPLISTVHNPIPSGVQEKAASQKDMVKKGMGWMRLLW